MHNLQDKSFGVSIPPSLFGSACGLGIVGIHHDHRTCRPSLPPFLPSFSPQCIFGLSRRAGWLAHLLARPLPQRLLSSSGQVECVSHIGLGWLKSVSQDLVNFVHDFDHHFCLTLPSKSSRPRELFYIRALRIVSTPLAF